MAGNDGPGINKFDGTDFAFWHIQIGDYLYSKKLHQPLSGKKLEKMEDDDWKLLDRQVLGEIRLTLTKNVAHNVAEANIMEEIMSIVLDMYEDHILTFVDGFCKGAMIVARGKKTGTLYMTSSCQDILAAVDAGANSSLRNFRLGHLSEKGLKMLGSNEKLPELKIVYKLCESCIFGKQKNVSFTKEGRDLKATKLELVHTDVWGPSPVTSLGGSRNYGTPVEDSSRKVWIYLVKNKSDGFETFKKWESAMEGDLDTLSSNQTWELVEVPGGKKSLRNKWEYLLEHGGSMWYKTMLVEGEKKIIDYTEIFSLMVKLTTIRCVLGFVAKEDLHLDQINVKSVFLRSELDEEMKQTHGIEVREKEKIVCKLRGSLFGLKQVPRQWCVKFDGFKNDDFLKCQADHCAYVKLDDSYIILLICVDDMIAGVCLKKIDKLAMKDLGAAKLILGMRILKDRNEKFLMLEKIFERMNYAGTLTKVVFIGKLKLCSTSFWLHV